MKGSRVLFGIALFFGAATYFAYEGGVGAVVVLFVFVVVAVCAALRLFPELGFDLEEPKQSPDYTFEEAAEVLGLSSPDEVASFVNRYELQPVIRDGKRFLFQSEVHDLRDELNDAAALGDEASLG